jgi:archaemetzincin
MRVDIVPVGDGISAPTKRAASHGLRRVYDCDIRIRESQPVPEDAYDPDRKQYRAEEFIETATAAAGGEKALALTDVDLYYHRRNYVFGLAYLGGRGCVVSTDRLRTSADGGFSGRSSAEVVEDRVRKEVVHEVGHTLGLEHCSNGRCVMHFSEGVQDVDRKEETLCGTCGNDVASS